MRSGGRHNVRIACDCQINSIDNRRLYTVAADFCMFRKKNWFNEMPYLDLIVDYKVIMDRLLRSRFRSKWDKVYFLNKT